MKKCSISYRIIMMKTKENLILLQLWQWQN
nr:MAG TPA: hypothetical protein [Bacteriophage sp.]